MRNEIDNSFIRTIVTQQVIEHWSQERVDEMVLAVGWENFKEENAEEIYVGI